MTGSTSQGSPSLDSASSAKRGRSIGQRPQPALRSVSASAAAYPPAALGLSTPSPDKPCGHAAPYGRVLIRPKTAAHRIAASFPRGRSSVTVRQGIARTASPDSSDDTQDSSHASAAAQTGGKSGTSTATRMRSAEAGPVTGSHEPRTMPATASADAPTILLRASFAPAVRPLETTGDSIHRSMP